MVILSLHLIYRVKKKKLENNKYEKIYGYCVIAIVIINIYVYYKYLIWLISKYFLEIINNKE